MKSSTSYIMFGIFGIMVISFVIAIGLDTFLDVKKRKIINERKEAWFSQHKCEPIGYTAKTDRLYKCDDGRTYIWRDIPTN